MSVINVGGSAPMDGNVAGSGEAKRAEAQALVERVRTRAAAESPQARWTRWEAETKRYKDVQAELEAKYGAQLEEANKRFEELDTKQKEASSAKARDDNSRAFNACLRLQQQWLAEAARLQPSDDEGTVRGPLFYSGCPDHMNLFQIIESQLLRERFMAWPNHPQPQLTSGLQEVIDGKELIGSLDKIVWDRLRFVQAQIDAMRQREEDPSLSEEHVRATLQRMRQLKAMLQAAKLPPDAEMRGPLFNNKEAGRSLPEIISLQIHREKREDKKFKSVLKSGLQEVIDGSKEQLDKTVLDRLCFLQEYYAAEGDRDWIQDPLLEQKLDALEVGSETHERRRREQEQRTKQAVQTILQHMRQQKAAGQAPDRPRLQIGAKQTAAGEGKVVPFQTRVAADTGRAIVPRKPKFRDFLSTGKLRPSLANAVIAIKALGIGVRYDLFHHRIKITYNGSGTTIREGLLTDDTVSATRSLINNTFEIDCGDADTLAAIKEIALTNAYDPVRDMLDECQGRWDGVQRLDTWVIKCLGCADTPLNRAIGRKVLIGACRRARKPGCKFDTITVLEGPEGINKSTAIRILADDENFSDQSILGATDKEVQEQLDGIWMHENADLAGMKRAEVEHVKAFASRQIDRARPAYGRFREDRPRRSIEWGTTNNDEYLLSQTGNRRIWPLKTDHIDLEALKRDREQLWGEAATYEAAGESITLDPALWGDARDAQERRRVKDPWEDLLDRMPETVEVSDGRYGTRKVTIIHKSGDGSERVASADVLTYVLNILKAQQTSAHGQRLAHAMKHTGWARNPSGRVTINGREERGYIRRSYGLSPAQDVPP